MSEVYEIYRITENFNVSGRNSVANWPKTKRHRMYQDKIRLICHRYLHFTDYLKIQKRNPGPCLLGLLWNISCEKP